MSEDVLLGLERGVHQRSKDTRVPGGFSRRVINLTPSTGGLRRRQGFTQFAAGTAVTSLWGDGARAFYTDGGALKSVAANGDITELATGLAAPFAYAKVGEEYWISSRLSNLRVAGDTTSAWTPPKPTSLPNASFSAAGTLPEGAYNLGITWIDAADQEGPPAVLQISGGGALVLTGLGAPAGYRQGIYLSTADTAVMYKLDNFSGGVAGITITGPATGRPLDSRFLDVMATGATQLALFRGRLYAVHGEVVTYSEPLQYGMTNPSENFIAFSEPVSLFAPVEGGIFVGHGNETVFLAGESPSAFELVTLDVAPPIPGTTAAVRPSWFELESAVDEGVFWLTEAGPVIGLSTGTVAALTDKVLKLPAAESAAVAVVEQEGERQLLAVARNPSEGVGIATDLIESEIIRNGRIVT